MLRTLLLTLVAAAVLPSSAHAAVLSNVSGDTLAVTGDGGADQITLRLASPRILQVNGSPFNRTTFSRISVRSGAGADEVRIDESGGVFTDSEITTIETGAGADVVSGGSGAEVIVTGDDGDFVSPGAGDDTVQLGAGDDTVLQHEGDARDLARGPEPASTRCACSAPARPRNSPSRRSAPGRCSRATPRRRGPTSPGSRPPR